jgi:hypothetical protein
VGLDPLIEAGLGPSDISDTHTLEAGSDMSLECLEANAQVGGAATTTEQEALAVF